MYHNQEVDKKGNFKITEGYYADSLFDYYKLASDLIDSLHDLSVGGHVQAQYCLSVLNTLHSKLEWILDTHPKS